MTLRNTIIANNSVANNSDGGNCALLDFTQMAQFDINDSNLSSDDSCQDALQMSDIGLDVLQANGGPPLAGSGTNSGQAPWTHALLPTSVAINKGDNAVCAADPINNVDQRGTARPEYATCDIGAYEFVETSAPLVTGPSTVTVWENQSPSIDIDIYDDLDSAGNGLTLTFGGADIAHFNADSGTGIVTFITPPDFENPLDAGGDNVYNIQATVTDSGGLNRTLDVAFTVLDIPECGPFPLYVGSAAELNAAIACYNYLPGGDYAINLTQDITLVTTTTLVSRADVYLDAPASLRINGNGHAIDGANSYPIFDIVDSTVTLANLTLQNGKARGTCFSGRGDTCGGALLVGSSATVTVTASTVFSNSADVGGGLHNAGALTLSSSTVYSNSANIAGGISNLGTMTVANSTISHNKAARFGGVLSAGDGLSAAGTITVLNSTFYGNVATDDAGGFGIIGATPTIRNTIFADNMANGLPSNCVGIDGTMADATNLDSDGSCGDALQSSSINLGPLQDNGPSTSSTSSPSGSGQATWTHALLDGSAARNAGDSTICAADPVNNVDQRGIPRPQFNTCDVGAFEHWINSAPVITSSNAITVSENQTSTIDVQATDDVDSEGSGLVFGLSGGADAAHFTIDTNTGVITFLNTPDFENPADAGVNNVYNIQVTVSDTTFITSALTDVQDIAIAVTDVDENVAPIITSTNAASVAENQTSAIDVNATDDADSEGAGLTFSLSGGADDARFAIDASTGLVTFNSAPDFENPADVGGDNQYNIQVTVTDAGGLTDVQDISITVTDIAEGAGPIITSSNAASVAENQTSAVDVNATDDMDSEGAGLTFSLSGGVDQTLFTIDANTGVVTFLTHLTLRIPLTWVGTTSTISTSASPIRVP